MDFVEWCERVLEGLRTRAGRSRSARAIGVTDEELARQIFRERAREGSFAESPAFHAMVQALEEMERLGFISRSGRISSLTDAGERHAADPSGFRASVCGQDLVPDEEDLLRVVNRESQQNTDDYSLLRTVDRAALLSGLGWDPEEAELLMEAATGLADLGFVRRIGAPGSLDLKATYAGVLRETRCGASEG